MTAMLRPEPTGITETDDLSLPKQLYDAFDSTKIMCLTEKLHNAVLHDTYSTPSLVLDVPQGVTGLVTPSGRRIDLADNAACYSFTMLPTATLVVHVPTGSPGDVPTTIVTHEPRRTGLLGGARGDGAGHAQ